MNDLDPDLVDRISTRAATLACPSRVEILLLLVAATDPPRQADIVRHLHLTQPTVAYHLRLLQDAELVACQRQSGASRYHLTDHGRTAVAMLGDTGTRRPHIGAST